jgi:hypothetical protein
MLIDVATLQLVDDVWCAKACDWPSPGAPDATAHRALPTVDMGEYAQGFRVASGPGWLSVSFAPKNTRKGVGCRVMALAWAGAVGLQEAAGAWRLVVNVRGGNSEVRGLLTLQVLADAHWRCAVLDQTDVVQLDADRTSATEYETAAVEYVSKSMPGWEHPSACALQMKKVRGKPDGILTHASSGRIVVIEAKHRPVTFEEGASQLFQYAAQARWALDRLIENVRFALVTSDPQAERKLQAWRELMRRACPTTILVPEECVKNVTKT